MKKQLLLATAMLTCFISNSQTNTHSLSFDYVDDYVDVPDNAALNPTTALTIEAWIKPAAWAINVYENYIVGKDDWSVSAAGYALRSGANGELSFNIASSGGVWQEVISSPVIPTGSWTHVAGTFDGSTLSIYINGVLANSLAYSGTIIPSTYNLNIGNVPYLGQGNRLFNGLIDQVEVWNIALTPTQINAYKLCPPVGTETGLVGLWKLEEGTGTLTQDGTSNNNDGTLMNSVTWSTDVQATTCGAGINEASQSEIIISPNPSDGTFVIQNQKKNISQITVTNLIGESIITIEKQTNNKVLIDLTNEQSGIYFVTVKYEDKSIARTKVVLR